MMNRRHVLMTGAAIAVAPKTFADSHGGNVVRMLNKAPDSEERQWFDPPVIQIAAGDSVKWVSTDRGHNSAANPDMIPEGADAWKGRINEDIEITFDTPGVYGYNCTPHQSAGMVGLVLVGDVTQEMLDEAASVRQRGKAKSRYEDFFALASEMIAGA